MSFFHQELAYYDFNNGPTLVQPDVAACGGITELKRIATMANTFGIEVIPHSWGTGIALHAGQFVLENFIFNLEMSIQHFEC